jgi:hypothetical protein
LKKLWQIFRKLPTLIRQAVTLTFIFTALDNKTGCPQTKAPLA